MVLFRSCGVSILGIQILYELKIRQFVRRDRLNKQIVLLEDTTVYVSNNPSVMIHV